MPDYRFYFVGPDGHFLNFKPLICGSDDEALAEAKQLVGGLFDLADDSRKAIATKAAA